MIHPRLTLSSLLLIATFFTGCQQKKDAHTEPAPDTNNTQAAPVHESSQRPSAPKYIASTPANATISRQLPLDISTLLGPEDVKKVFGQKQLRVEELTGQPATADYNGLRIVAQNSKKPMYGVGLQVWRFTDLDDANNQFNKLKSQYLGVQEIPADLIKAAANGFISERGGIRNYLVAAQPSNIIAISCEKSLCSNWSELINFAKVAQSRL